MNKKICWHTPTTTQNSKQVTATGRKTRIEIFLPSPKKRSDPLLYAYPANREKKRMKTKITNQDIEIAFLRDLGLTTAQAKAYANWLPKGENN